MFETPILFLIFNRPETTKKVFDVICQIKPSKLFIGADGPRKTIAGDEEQCVAAREIVCQGIDWNCEIKYLFQSENLGCGAAVRSSIEWFFDHVEEGIILEDDTLPDTSFFYYCQRMLTLYRNDKRIWSISGFNFGADDSLKNVQYTFSRFMNMWGWATWKRSFNNVDYNLTKWRHSNNKVIFTSLLVQENFLTVDFNWINYWVHHFGRVVNKEVDTWDYQWIYSQLLCKQVTIYPAINMVENLGFNEFATHTTNVNSPMAKVTGRKMDLHFAKTSKKVNKEFEQIYIKNVWCEVLSVKTSLRENVKFKLRQLKYNFN